MKFGHKFADIIEATHPDVSDQVRVRERERFDTSIAVPPLPVYSFSLFFMYVLCLFPFRKAVAHSSPQRI